jgi:ZIP family zinc transporter
LPHVHVGHDESEREGIKTPWGKSTLMFLAVTLHNFPEGMAVGVAFGALAYCGESATLAAAMALALGIGIQNLPEGAAVSIPLRREGLSRWKSFFWGQFSGMVEPIGGVLGAAMALAAKPILPYTLAFACRRDGLCGGGRSDSREPGGKHGHWPRLGDVGFCV